MGPFQYVKAFLKELDEKKKKKAKFSIIRSNIGSRVWILLYSVLQLYMSSVQPSSEKQPYMTVPYFFDQYRNVLFGGDL